MVLSVFLMVTRVSVVAIVPGTQLPNHYHDGKQVPDPKTSAAPGTVPEPVTVREDNVVTIGPDGNAEGLVEVQTSNNV